MHGQQNINSHNQCLCHDPGVGNPLFIEMSFTSLLKTHKQLSLNQHQNMRTANIPTTTVFWTSAVWSNSPHSAYHDVLLELFFSLCRGFFTLSEQTKHSVGTLANIHDYTLRQTVMTRQNLRTSRLLLPPYFRRRIRKKFPSYIPVNIVYT